MSGTTRRLKAQVENWRRWLASRRNLYASALALGAGLSVLIIVFSRIGSGLHASGPQRTEAASEQAAPLAARPSKALRDAVAHDHVDFETALVSAIRERGYLSVTVHVALYSNPRGGRRALTDGARASGNMYWGARYGVDTQFARADGWSRVFQDNGDGSKIVRRSVFQRTVDPSDEWQARGIDQPFDIYLLAAAWPDARIVEAMEQPLRDALCDGRTTIEIEGKSVDFGGGSQLVGYLGQNRMLTQYWNPFEKIGDCPPAARQAGVFYLAPRSAVLLHRPSLDYGLYSVLFAREAITPEAYLLEGMLNAVVSGKLGDDFVSEAAAAYVQYQPSVKSSQAKMVLVR